MNKNISLSIFFPAYNEEANIGATIKTALDVAEQLNIPYEIIVVNDGSKDKTAEIAASFSRQYPQVRVINHPVNQGYGAAVLSGIKAAKYSHVFFTDADLQFDLYELYKLLEFVPDYQAVLGYRAKRRDPWMRLANAKGWNILNRLLFGLQVKDIDCAFKLFKTDVVQNLPVKSRGAMLSAEILINLQRRGVAFKEVPVTHLPRVAGSPTGAKPAVILRAFKEMLFAYSTGLTARRS